MKQVTGIYKVDVFAETRYKNDIHFWKRMQEEVAYQMVKELIQKNIIEVEKWEPSNPPTTDDIETGYFLDHAKLFNGKFDSIYKSSMIIFTKKDEERFHKIGEFLMHIAILGGLPIKILVKEISDLIVEMFEESKRNDPQETTTINIDG